MRDLSKVYREHDNEKEAVAERLSQLADQLHTASDQLRAMIEELRQEG